jgi:hypothetical protein
MSVSRLASSLFASDDQPTSRTLEVDNEIQKLSQTPCLCQPTALARELDVERHLSQPLRNFARTAVATRARRPASALNAMTARQGETLLRSPQVYVA